MTDPESWTTLHRRQEQEQQAIQMALRGRWEEAEQLNRAILEENPRDADALNRLGKALLEQGRYEEAQDAYGKALELDPYNRIARKNRDRLAKLLASRKAQARAEAAGREQIRPDLFISESGKSAVVPLHGLIPSELLHQLSRGDVVRLEASEQTVLVKTEEGEVLGRLDPRIGRRLAEFIRTGNRYAAAVAELDERGAKIFVRETFQHQRLVGRLSFPPLSSAQTGTVRPYIRDLSLHLQEAFETGLDEEEEIEEEDLEEEDTLDEESDGDGGFEEDVDEDM